MKKFFIVCWMLLCYGCLSSVQAQSSYQLRSPDGRLEVTVTPGSQLTYRITCGNQPVLQDSPLSMTLDDGSVWGPDASPVKVTRSDENRRIETPFYRSRTMTEHYNSLVLHFKEAWKVEFRAYNDGIAYRFSTDRSTAFRVVGEEVSFCFPDNATARVPYVVPRSDDPFYSAFENTYTPPTPLTRLDHQRLMFLPLLVETGDNVKVCLTESDLEDYPGLYLSSSADTSTLTGVHAPYPRTRHQGGHNNLQQVVDEREAYIARCEGARTFPWRVLVITTDDRQLAASNLTYLLAAPSRIRDLSWIKPGKTAWEWWSDCNLYGVDFTTGINDDTYKAYIDFAARNGLEYVLLDEGWSVNGKADLMQVVDDIHLEELVAYATARGVGIWLWAGYYAFDRDMEQLCAHYAKMGIKGFKVDFMDRDDQEMVSFVHRAAATCARHHLLLDLHGMYKPAGLNRTYPNLLNFEGVHGLENMKWSPDSVDQVTYDVTLPFIRQVAGPLDYTPGAMRNAAQGNYFPCYSEPMSQGTRCRQLALYLVFDAPLAMLCDTPTAYQQEPAYTAFLAGIPTVWDETRILDAKVGEYIVTARRHHNTWYIGGITGTSARDITLPCHFLSDGTHRATLYTDGVNAAKVGRDYRCETRQLTPQSQLTLHLAPGGGFAIKIE